MDRAGREVLAAAASAGTTTRCPAVLPGDREAPRGVRCWGSCRRRGSRGRRGRRGPSCWGEGPGSCRDRPNPGSRTASAARGWGSACWGRRCSAARRRQGRSSGSDCTACCPAAGDYSCRLVGTAGPAAASRVASAANWAAWWEACWAACLGGAPSCTRGCAAGAPGAADIRLEWPLVTSSCEWDRYRQIGHLRGVEALECSVGRLPGTWTDFLKSLWARASVSCPGSWACPAPAPSSCHCCSGRSGPLASCC